MAQNLFYYSNYCKHSQKVFNILIKARLENEFEFICIDKRGRDPSTNQTFIILENGKRMLLPPNVHSVPAMLLVKEQYRVLYGDEILDHYNSKISNDTMVATQFNGEPMAHNLGGNDTLIGNSLADSYSNKLSIIQHEQKINNKTKMGDSAAAVDQYEKQRQEMDRQLGIGQKPANPFLL
jgi:N-acetylglutamate synthase/N-acetylornithine aminotransferase